MDKRLGRGDGAERPADGLAALALRWRLLRDLAAVLGLRCEADSEPSGPGDDSTNQDEIQAAIDARIAAKSAKNYAEADRIRDELKAQGIELIDKPGGITEWIRR